ncbi:MAG: hypothetical protein HYS08_10750 [Chlamydiae bacterium]|nr:hypothetical protein [Chlamydiota bacterium]MBI3266603.1 hypothetical protein [Chlamydiota bacterium]
MKKIAVGSGLLFLAIVVAAVFLFKFWHGSKRLQTGLSLESDEKMDVLFLSEKRAPLDWGLDPFRSPHQVPQNLSVNLGTLDLTGILWSRENRAAIINDKVVHTGDSMEGFKIVEIFKDHLLIEKDDKTFELRQKGAG